MRRYMLADLVGTGSHADPIRPSGASNYVVIGTIAGRAIVMTTVAAGTAVTAATIADRQTSDGAASSPTDALLVRGLLSGAQQTTIQTFLAARGIDVTDFAGTTDRRLLFRFIARKLGLDPTALLAGYDLADGGA